MRCLGETERPPHEGEGRTGSKGSQVDTSAQNGEEYLRVLVHVAPFGPVVARRKGNGYGSHPSSHHPRAIPLGACWPEPLPVAPRGLLDPRRADPAGGKPAGEGGLVQTVLGWTNPIPSHIGLGAAEGHV